jgi:hypothetical protein
MKHARIGILVAFLFVLSSLYPDAARAQAASSKSKPENATATQPGGGTPGLGFSMESEMLTYAAMEHNSHAIACDVASYIYKEEERNGVQFTPPPSQPNPPTLTEINTLEQLCAYAQWYANSKEQPRSSVPEADTKLPPTSVREDGIVILQASSTIQTDLELWRTYMAEMESLYQAEVKQAASTGCNAGTKAQAAGLRFGDSFADPLLVRLAFEEDPSPAAQQSKSASSSPMPLGETQGVVNLAQQMVAANESSEAVRGTVESQTFVNTIAGWLRVLGIPVLIPETSMPHSLSMRRKYRILEEADKLRELRPCLLGNGSSPSPSPLLLNDIDAFLASTFGWSAVADPANNGKPTMTFSPSNVVALLSADLLAQQLHIGPANSPDTANTPSPTDQAASDETQWRHILWVRALESGGSVIKRERFWGSKIRYSGGSIVTYALATLDGPLECSGSFNDYGGPLAASDFYKKKDHLTLEAGIPLYGGCRALIKRQGFSGIHQ